MSGSGAVITVKPIIRPEPPSTTIRGGDILRPEDYNPDIAAAKMAQELVRQTGAPGIVSKAFVVRKGIFEGLNHTEINLTGYDSRIRMHIYNQVMKDTVHIDGQHFRSVWAYLMKPRYIINQQAGTPYNTFEQEQPGFFRRIINKVTGGGNEPNNP